MTTDNVPAPRRKIDKSNQLVRRALADSIEQIGRWRMDAALMQARAGRRLNDADRMALRRQCTNIEAGIMEIRTGLIVDLAEAPSRIKAHSRVVDVEKALDNLEATLGDLQRHLAAN